MPDDTQTPERPWYRGLFSGDGLLSRNGPGGIFSGINSYMQPTADEGGVDKEVLGQSRSTLLGNLGALLYASSMPGLQNSDRARLIAQMPSAFAAQQDVLKEGQNAQLRRAQTDKLKQEAKADEDWREMWGRAARGGQTTSSVAPAQQTAAMPSINDGDVDAMARTMLAEAGNQGEQGLTAVGAVIANRSRLTGLAPSEVVRQPNQFEPWGTEQGRARIAAIRPDSPEYQKAAQIARGVLSGQAPDPTGGATHFLNPALQAQLGREQPAWAPANGGQRIGDHVFYSRPADFGRRTQVASAGNVASDAPTGAPAPAQDSSVTVGGMRLTPDQATLAGSMGRKEGSRMLLQESLSRDNTRVATPEERRQYFGGAPDDPRVVLQTNVRTGKIEPSTLPNQQPRWETASDAERASVLGGGASNSSVNVLLDRAGGQAPMVIHNGNVSRPMTEADWKAHPNLDRRLPYVMGSDGKPVEIGNASQNSSVANDAAERNFDWDDLKQQRDRVNARMGVMPQAEQLMDLLQRGGVDGRGVPTGWDVETGLRARQMLVGLGMASPSTTQGVTYSETVQALTRAYQAAQVNKGEGAVSDSERELHAQASARLGATPEANKFNVASYITITDWQRRVQEARRAYMDEHKNLRGFNEAYIQEHVGPTFQTVGNNEAGERMLMTARPGTLVRLAPELRRLSPNSFPFYVVPPRDRLLQTLQGGQ